MSYGIRLKPLFRMERLQIGIHRGQSRDSLARHERNAQSRRPRIFRRPPRCRMGYDSNRSSGWSVFRSEFIAGNPEIPWRGMRGMRNRVAHGYFDVHLDVVWDTTQTALPDGASSDRNSSRAIPRFLGAA